VLDDASKQELSRLCDFVAKEQDRQRLSGLVDELIQLLDHIDRSGNKEVRTAPLSSRSDGS
jgi:hypothetical protein